MRDDEWGGWVSRNFGLSVSKARKYMELATACKFGFRVSP